METTCPNCKHSYATAPTDGRRKCALCGQNIGKHDKWFFNADGKVQHRHCDHPQEYVHPDSKKPPEQTEQKELS